MTTDWTEWRVEDLAERVAMGPFGSSIRVDTFVPDGVPVISGRHLNGSRLYEDEFNYVSTEHADRLKNSNAYRGDVVFTHAGNIGQVAVIPETSRFARYQLSQRQFKLTPKTEVADPRFLAYYFSSPHGQHQLLANASSTGVPSIARPVTYLRSLKIFLPPIEEQRAIASVLGALDNKIELNRRMNETLEALARAIFTSWFVDFDPVRARAEGRQPVGMDAETAALFPDSFEASPLGPIPSGWQVVSVGHVVAFSRDSLDPADSPEEIFDHYSIPAFDGGGRPRSEAGNTIRSAKFIVPDGAVLLSKLNPRISRVWLPSPPAERRAIASTEFLVSMPREDVHREWLYCLYRTASFLDRLRGLVTGTSGSHQRVRPEEVLALPIVVPPTRLVATFERVVRPMLDRVRQADAESASLEATRDAVLPKLVSGEVRIGR